MMKQEKNKILILKKKYMLKNLFIKNLQVKKIMQLCLLFIKLTWKEKFLVLQKFKDERLRYFGKKILYEESPQSLPKDEYNSIHKEIASRVLSTNKEKWNTIPRTYSEIDT